MGNVPTKANFNCTTVNNSTPSTSISECTNPMHVKKFSIKDSTNIYHNKVVSVTSNPTIFNTLTRGC
ncbi:hypothetical protein DDB_G0282821 [Dictyostelium discoideum AX4]|uniref:Uncharacterized protein n=1 Tax=Dictyostelium discoideum TaxID=44689 RepID=Q54RZ6_DICDI|nr:hypothetical protein DDB_G0282821 [Dictyostelium discoideum AX4]EAL65990.1 hypothetical protein DDB_G0282821 [Dictyostelium discoideum AX4]|eukprot:XP_639341.1 hypothetical protein DDB_G0282821 [Dictyostelium discoideum AX4]